MICWITRAKILVAVTTLIIPPLSSAEALELPLTPAAAKAAIAEGARYKGIPDAYAAGAEWRPRADAETPSPAGTALQVETPFSLLFFESADASAQYREVSPQAVKEALATRTLDTDALVFSERVAANDGARLVVRQEGKIIQPLRCSVTHAAPTDRFWQHVHAAFDIHRLNMRRPMTIILANAMISSEYQSAVTEIRYSFDPLTVR